LREQAVLDGLDPCVQGLGRVALADRLAERAGRYRPDVIAREVEKVLRSVCLGR